MMYSKQFRLYRIICQAESEAGATLLLLVHYCRHATWCQAGVEEAIRKAMMRHPTDADIAQYGSRTLSRLTQEGEECAQEVCSGFRVHLVAVVGLIFRVLFRLSPAWL